MKFNNEIIIEAAKEWLENEELAETKYGHISNWDTSGVTEMKALFYPGYRDGESKIDTSLFNEDISRWNVSNVNDMSRLFENCLHFNQDISSWDVSNVNNMSHLFENCLHFNQDISSWDVSNVTDMNNLFENCLHFNQDISSWDVSNVTSMQGMFKGCNNFNQDIGKWNIDNVRSFSNMFKKATSFYKKFIKPWGLSEKKNGSVFGREPFLFSENTFSNNSLIKNPNLKLETIINYLKNEEIIVLLTTTVEYESWIQYKSDSDAKRGSIAKTDTIDFDDEDEIDPGMFKFLKDFEKFDLQKKVYENSVIFEVGFICENHYLTDLINFYISNEDDEDNSNTWGDFNNDNSDLVYSVVYEELWGGVDLDFEVRDINKGLNDNFIRVKSIKTKDAFSWGHVLDMVDIEFKFDLFKK